MKTRKAAARKKGRRSKERRVSVPVAHLTYLEEAHKASTKAYRAFKRWLKK